MSHADVGAIRDLAQQYNDSAKNRQFDTLKSLFHLDAVLIGSYFGEYMRLTVDDWIVFMKAEEPKENPEKASFEILSSDVEGDIGFVKLKSIDGDIEYIDYLSMQKIADKWVIINKTFRVVM